MDDHDDQGPRVTNKRTTPPSIRIEYRAPDENSWRPQPLQTSSTVFEETTSPSSFSVPTLTPKPPHLTVAGGAIPSDLHWLDLYVNEDRKQVDPSSDFGEKLSTQVFEGLPCMFGLGTSITGVTVCTYQSLEFMRPAMNHQG